MILSILEVDSLVKTLLIEQFNWTIEIVWKSNRKKKKKRIPKFRKRLRDDNNLDSPQWILITATNFPYLWQPISNLEVISFFLREST